ncbi:hypothetical protein O2K51_08690 [Apibacter raozihei]|uniref:hypothetical protein n=1 Tax=Apibacter TaxID=1778601 RepID=UPI000FE32D8D|nr:MULTISPECIES: hypothetical protein [Apibacter]
MELPKFLIADNSNFPDDLFVVHTEYPRFILNVEEEEVEWFDQLEGEEEDVTNEVNELLQQAFDFCDAEIDKYEEEDEN